MIAEEYDAVGVEDLDMKAMSRCLHLGKGVMDNSYGMFRNILSYKLEERGKIWFIFMTYLSHQDGESKRKSRQ